MPITPTWFTQRQLKMEEVDSHRLRVFGPNFRDIFVGIRPTNENNLYEGYLKSEPEGEDQATTGLTFASEINAWEAAFELLRGKVVL